MNLNLIHDDDFCSKCFFDLNDLIGRDLLSIAPEDLALKPRLSDCFSFSYLLDYITIYICPLLPPYRCTISR